ncbi:hypothetical protein IMZ48_49750 [Candidatus Bathyarchaeota archaeon]|nr:hypothetical protein [Candidatus Bathyarchaeota archaeon]
MEGTLTPDPAPTNDTPCTLPLVDAAYFEGYSPACCESGFLFGSGIAAAPQTCQYSRTSSCPQNTARGSSPGCGTPRFAPGIPEGAGTCDRALLCDSLSSARPRAVFGICVLGGRRRLAPSLEARRSCIASAGEQQNTTYFPFIWIRDSSGIDAGLIDRVDGVAGRAYLCVGLHLGYRVEKQGTVGAWGSEGSESTGSL